jgi:hypothetical protein
MTRLICGKYKRVTLECRLILKILERIEEIRGYIQDIFLEN